MKAERSENQLSSDEVSAIIQILVERQFGVRDQASMEDLAEAFSLDLSVIVRLRQEFADSRDFADFRRRVDLLEEQNLLLKRIVAGQSSKIGGLQVSNTQLQKKSDDSDVIVSAAFKAMSRQAPKRVPTRNREPNWTGVLIFVIGMSFVGTVVYWLNSL